MEPSTIKLIFKPNHKTLLLRNSLLKTKQIVLKILSIL